MRLFPLKYQCMCVFSITITMYALVQDAVMNGIVCSSIIHLGISLLNPMEFMHMMQTCDSHLCRSQDNNNMNFFMNECTKISTPSINMINTTDSLISNNVTQQNTPTQNVNVESGIFSILNTMNSACFVRCIELKFIEILQTTIEHEEKHCG